MPSYTVKSCGNDNALVFGHQRKLVRKSNGDLWTTYFRSDGTTYQIYVAYSVNSGVDWTEEKITSQTGTNHQYCPSLAIDSNDDVHLIWTGWGWGVNNITDNLQYRKRTSGGWQAQEAVTDQYGDQKRPAIAIDSSGNVHVVWVGGGWGSNPTYPNIRYRKRTTSWQAQEAVTDKNYPQYDAAIAIDLSDNVHTTWYGAGWGSYPTYSNIQYRRRTTSWQTQEAVTNKNNWQERVSIAVDSVNTVHVIWNGKGWGSYPTYDNIQYRRRTTSWQTQETVTNRDWLQHGPAIAIDASNNVHAIWFGLGWGTNTGYYNIQYRKRTTSWQTQVGVTDVAVDQAWCNLIWSLHPTVGGVKTNRPLTGYAFVWMAGEILKYYASADLLFQTLLAGTIASSSGVTGSIEIARGLASTITATSGATGSIKRIRGFAGTIATTSGVSGSLTGIWTIAGTITSNSSVTGSMTGEWTINGTVDVQSGVSGPIRVTKKLTSVIVSTGGISGSIKVAKELVSVTIAVTSGASGSIKCIRELISTIACSSSITGSIGTTRKFTGTIASNSGVTGSIKRIRSISRTTVCESTVSGLLTSWYLFGTVAAQSGISGSIKVTKELTGTIAAQSIVSGDLTTREFFGTIACNSGVTGAIEVTKKFTGTIAASSTTSGSVKVVREFTSTIATQSVVSGSIKTVYKIAGLIDGVSAVTGTLTKSVPITGTIASQSGISGPIKVSRELTSEVSCISTTTGSIKVTRKMVCEITVQSGASGILIVEVLMVGTIACVSTVTGPLKVIKKLRSITITESDIDGLIKVSRKLVGTIAGQSTLSGRLAYLVVPEFLTARSVSISPVFAHATRVNAELKRDVLTR